MKNNSCVLATDFDGTISKKDFFWHIIDKVLTEKDIEPWDDYKEGRITHFEGLNRIFRKIRLEIKDLHQLIIDIPVEECFTETMKFCLDNNINVYIISAGADYYIKLILEKLNIKNNIKIIANQSVYSPKHGLVMEKYTQEQEFYSYNYGVNKAGVIKYLKSNYKKVVFAGDGTPDYAAAKHADVVFARGDLMRQCRENNLKVYKLDSYCNVLDYLKNNNCT